MNNLAPTVTIQGTGSTNEGSVYTLQLAATGDPGTDTVSQWTINWGDGSTQNIAGNPSSVTHVYADGPNSYTISATVTDEDGSYSSNSLAVTVRNVAPQVTIAGAASVNEGAVYSLTLFAGNDPGTDTIASWQINWGDGSTQNITGNPSSVTHVYADGPNSYTISATVTDEDGSYGSNTLAVTVLNVAPTLTLSGPATVNEGSAYTLNLSVADPGTDTIASWQVNWGDGSTQNITGNPSLTHTYTDGANAYTISATATDEDGTYSSNTLAVTVLNVAPTLTLSGAPTVNEAALYTLNLASSDPGQDTISRWSVNWGDGVTQTVVGNPSSLTHTYADGPNSYTITATATDEDGTFNAVPFTVNVLNVAPTLIISGPAQVNEGSLYTLRLSSSDPGIDTITSWQINWGDGNVQTVSGNPASVTHTYLEGPNDFLISATATDEDGTFSANSISVTVNNVAPVLPTLTQGPTANEGQVMNFSATFSDAGILDTHTAIIRWGDGTSDAATISGNNGQGIVSGSHVYADNGNYALRVDLLTDDDGGTTNMMVMATIANVNPTVTAAANQSVPENTLVTLPLATFTDPGFNNAVAGTQETFTASIDWGDGSAASAGTVNVTQGSAGTLTAGTVSGSHLFAHTGTFTVTVTVLDDDLGSGAATLTLTVLVSASAKFYVVDESAHSTFRYQSDGVFISESDTHHDDKRPRGIASNAAGDTLWVIDNSSTKGNKEVFVYNSDGSLRGSWGAGGLNQPQDITTDGVNIWIVDNSKDKVFYYANAASRLSGSQNPTSSFNLDINNRNPSGIVTYGGKLWVTDDFNHINNVFVYNTAGVKLGAWFLDPANDDPAGITLNPASGDDLWVVDRHVSKVFYYPGASSYLSGSHSAAATFDLSGANHHAEGIADPPVLTLNTPDPAAYFTAGSQVLLSGHVQSPDAPLSSVQVNGTQASVIDAAGNFFNSVVLAAGANAYTVTGVDQLGQTASVNRGLAGDQPKPGAINFHLLSDVTPSFLPEYGRTSFNYSTSVLYADLAVHNIGQYAVDTPLLVGVTHISEPTVAVRNADGVTPDGIPYYNFSDLVNGGTMFPGDQSDNGTLAFYNPDKVPFTYDLVILGRLNHRPVFTTAPVVEISAGHVYDYASEASDIDGHPLTYSLVSGPSGLQVGSDTGLVNWQPSTADVGTHVITCEPTTHRLLFTDSASLSFCRFFATLHRLLRWQSYRSVQTAGCFFSVNSGVNYLHGQPAVAAIWR